uniref:Maspardin n=1 Tax=Picea sitchensis TaxID=3332 RepID=D5ADI4_PICSI|nr:unknown [Picea sitchensis]
MATGPGDYLHFKGHVPLHHISIGVRQWRYYDYGPKEVPPLVCLSDMAGTADVFYKQILFLSMKVHLYGTSLGGFLAQLFTQHCPRRVKSLVLSNTFLETRPFADAMPWSSLINWTPCFMLKRYILTGIRDGPHEPFIADSVDFVVNQIETLSREDLASRFTLNTAIVSIGRLLLPDSAITIMDFWWQTNDYCAIPQLLKDQLGERYPGAKRAFLKTGGEFPFLSRADEVNLHLQLHLRRVGVEGRPDLIKGPSWRDDAWNSERKNDDTENDSDSWKNTGNSFSHLENGTPPSESTGSSYSIDEHISSSASKSVNPLTLAPEQNLKINSFGLLVEFSKFLVVLTVVTEFSAIILLSLISPLLFHVLVQVILHSGVSTKICPTIVNSYIHLY